MSRALDTLSAGLFVPFVGSPFVLRRADGLTLPVSLARCDETPRSAMPGGARMAFSLELSRPVEGVPPFTGGEFVLSHGILGEVGPLYVERILPTGYGPGTAVFQIIVN